MKKRKRISFSKVKPNHILANSCNFMTVEKDTMALDALLGYMNSSFVDWRFKMTSSNNHVNNYELLEIPLPDPHTFRTSYLHIQEEVERYVSTFDAPHLAAIDAEVFRLFRCDVDEVLHILTELQKPISYISRVLFLAFHERTVQKLLAEYMEKLEKNPE